MPRKAGDEKLLKYDSLIKETLADYDDVVEELDEAEVLSLEALNRAITKYHARGRKRTIDPPPVDDVSSELVAPWR